MARLYVPLDVEFATNERILGAGPLAAYLYVCSLAYAKRQGGRDGREGFVNDGALRVLTIGFPGKAATHAQALVDAGLWEPIDGGWSIPAWLKHNKSSEEIAADKLALKEKSVLGNHRRHHEAKGERNPDCILCYPPDSSPRGEIKLPPGKDSAPKVKGEGREGKGEVKGEAKANPLISQNGSSKATPTTAGGENPSSREQQVIDNYVRIGIDGMKARGEPIKSLEGITGYFTDKARAHDRFPSWCELFPTAPADAVAGWLHGDKGSMRYYPRADEIAAAQDGPEDADIIAFPNREATA